MTDNSIRRPLVIGNWKMNGDGVANERLLAALRTQIEGELLEGVDIGVCPPAVYISQAASLLSGSGVSWGAQNVASSDDGAFTGEISAVMLRDLACRWVLVGHSERRQLYGETNQDVATKATKALAQTLRPVICIGESLEQRQADVTERVLAEQIAALAPVFAAADCDQYVIAYEPIWAIGTGLTATPEQAQAVHAFVRSTVAAQIASALNQEAARSAAERLRILYGGSVKAGNAADLFDQADVDGGLIGGASLVADDFVAICRAALSGRRK